MLATIATVAGSIEDVEESAALQRRNACARAAAARADHGGESSDDDDLDLAEDDPATGTILTVRTLPVAASIGGKLWDASLLMGAWLTSPEAKQFFPPAAAPGRSPRRLLELGAGLGVVGLACARAFPSFHTTLSDYDSAVLDNLHENIRLNAPTPELQQQAPEQQLCSVACVDFRDFATAGFLHPLSGQFDMLIAADVVYEQSHCALAQVCLSMLAAPDPPAGTAAATPATPATPAATWQPSAVFMLPDSRPRLGEFVAALQSAGLDCRIERAQPSAEMVRRLRRTHEGWGAGDASFSLYVVTRRGA